MRRAFAAAVVGIVAFTAAGAPAAPDRTAGLRTTTVNVTEKEWSVAPSPGSVRAGPVTFRVRNTGRLAHEFVVVRTNRPAAGLPVAGERAVVTGLVGALARFRPGGLRAIRIALRPGRYVLLCNLPGHYRAGQFARFRVR